MSATKELLFKLDEMTHQAEMACYDSILAMLSLANTCWIDDNVAVAAPSMKRIAELREYMEEAMDYLSQVEAAAEQLKN